MARFYSQIVLLLALLGRECAAAPRGNVDANLARDISLRAPSDISSRAVTHQEVGWISYIYPGFTDTWSRLIGYPSNKLSILIANVADGPAYEGHPNEAYWKDIVTKGSASGKKVIGYVRTGYFSIDGQFQTRKNTTLLADWVEQIEGDIDLWYSLYPGIAGIFFDEGWYQCGDSEGSTLWSDTYRSLSNYAKSKQSSAFTVINPGGKVPQCYETSADTLLTFEGPYARYVDEAVWATYELKWDHTPESSKIWHVVNNVSEADLGSVVQLTKNRGAGYIGITNDTKPNEYDEVPSNDYMNTLFSLLAGS